MRAIFGVTALGILLALSAVVWPEALSERTASLEDVSDLRMQIGGMLATSVVLIGGFGSLLYAKGVAELRGEMHTLNAQVNGRIDQVNERLVSLTGKVDAQNGRLAKAEAQIESGYARMINLIEQHAVLFESIRTDLSVMKGGVHG